jgi:major membrane immunogen (membrane-anchored lipoprotein)
VSKMKWVAAALGLTLILSACGAKQEAVQTGGQDEQTEAVAASGEQDAGAVESENAEGALKDGQYRAEYDRNDVRNWKAFVDVKVEGGKITKAYYDYVNEKGDLRTNDENYTKNFEAVNKMTPRAAFDQLEGKLLDAQDIAKVDAVAGATHSSRNFNELAVAALAKAASGDTATAIVNLYEDGVYKVEAEDFDSHGWKPTLELTIKDHNIAGVDFDYVNPDGKLKSTDEEYKAAMEAQSGTYPEKYMAELEQQLIDKQQIGAVDAISGATHSSENFHALVEYALDDLAEIGQTEPAKMKFEE